MTTITKDQIHLIDGEISIIDKYADIKAGDSVYDSFMEIIYTAEKDSKGGKQYLWKITHSTASLEGVTKLDRSVFVKPKNLEKLAADYALENAQCMCNDREYGFEAGYNAKKGEFSRDDLERAIFYGRIIGEGFTHKYSYDQIVDMIRPLSMPESITINNNEVTANWE